MKEQTFDAAKRRMNMILESEGGGERIVHSMIGECYSKGRHVYLRYTEPLESGMGWTVTTIRVERDEVRVIRYGDVKLEQTFAIGQRQRGYLQTPQGRIELETVTDSLDVSIGDLDDSLFIRWSYELSVMGEAAERHQIVLTAVPLCREND